MEISAVPPQPIVNLARPEIPSLTGLRFVAAFSILFAHAFDWLFYFSDSSISRYFSFTSLYGMPLFFVLSGFVIHYNYAGLFGRDSWSKACRTFAIARIARIYPLFFVLLIFAIEADGLLPATGYDPRLALHILFRYVTLTQTWTYSTFAHREIINWLFALSWSVSTETFFYFAYALLVHRASVFASRSAAVAACVLFTLVVLVLSMLGADHRQVITDLSLRFPQYILSDADFNNSFYRWALYFSPYSRLPEFVLGCLTAQLYAATMKVPPSRRETVAGSIALAAALGFSAWYGWAWLHMGPRRPVMTDYVSFTSLNFGLAPAIAIAMFWLARYRTWLSPLLDSATLKNLGERSYSLYLVQSWTVNLVNRGTPLPLSSWSVTEGLLRVALGMATTFLIADASYRLIELPGKRLLRTRLAAIIRWPPRLALKASTAQFGGAPPDGTRDSNENSPAVLRRG